MGIEIVPLSNAIGAEVRGIDVSQPLDERTFSDIEQAWFRHQVLLFRGQTLTDRQLVDFSARFGVPERAPPNEAANKLSDGTVPGLPEITVISNVIENGVAIGALGAGEAEWHTDMSYNPLPPNASLLYSLEVPPAGGNTGFTNMYLAYETLPEDLKAVVEHNRAIHDASYTSAGGLRKGCREVTDVREAPGARHPMVRTHPRSGRNALFLGRRRNSYIVGLPLAESEQVLDRLWAHASNPRFAWHHAWKTGDLLMWDNRCVMHRRDPFDPAERRVMHRTQLLGELPVYRPAQRETATA